MMVRPPLTDVEIQRGQRVGALLRRARGSRTVLDVALSAGVSAETLRKIETGRVATPSFAIVGAIAKELEISLDMLWDTACSGETPVARVS